MRTLLYTAAIVALTALPALANESYTTNWIAEIEGKMAEVEAPADLESRKKILESRISHAPQKLQEDKARLAQSLEELKECDPEMGARAERWNALNIETAIFYSLSDNCTPQLEEYGAARIGEMETAIDYWSNTFLYRNTIAEEFMREEIVLLRATQPGIDRFMQGTQSAKTGKVQIDWEDSLLDDAFYTRIGEINALESQAANWRTQALDAAEQLDIRCAEVASIVGYEAADGLMHTCFPSI
ncbi:hypothetical protein HOD38_00400 [archaeon]|jgi:hypothetical protein|nr:hypothetical protein [archaeon]MBT4396707.1 hypothetical protein [archaeon]MBT4441317.1 hypothetical protein [archaeon]